MATMTIMKAMVSVMVLMNDDDGGDDDDSEDDVDGDAYGNDDDVGDDDYDHDDALVCPNNPQMIRFVVDGLKTTYV